ncbi:glycosyltransferase family 2 protein [Candidatus Woesearchaeota archaeon]|nr:glycosyltransferase family 2 protein [Candidatus Woesearchaeota archaeon]
MKLSIIMPAYNEEKNILGILKKVERVKLHFTKEIIIVDDGSKDRTREILKKIRKKQIKIFFHEKNRGKGAAIRTGISKASGDVILIQDADDEYDPNEYPKLLAPILKGATVVYGSRFTGRHHPRYRFYYLGNKILTLLTNFLYASRITDMETCYKVFRRDALNGVVLRAKRFDFEPEITAKLLKNSHNIVEVPISYRSRSFKEGKKITWKDGIKAMFYLVKYRFTD